MSPTLTIFVGPTASGMRLADLLGENVAIRPPVRRGDLRQLVDESSEPGDVAIVDGTFHSYPSVSHAEIRDALGSGWSVWGLSSMGAIRAAEMSQHGMRGFGAVYDRYATCDDFDDDEVAQIHEADAPYRPLSEPMIHLREFVRALTDRLVLSQATANSIVSRLKNRWYAERTLFLLRQLLTEAGCAASDINEPLNAFDQFRLKRIDLVKFLAERPWR